MIYPKFTVQGVWQALLLTSTLGLLIYTFTPGKAFGGRQLKPEAERKPMPDFTLADLDGTKWTMASHRGNVVLVNFWASWCNPCRRETPALVSVANAYKDKGLDVAGISMDEAGSAAARPFVEEYHIPYPVLLPTSDFKLADAVDGLPTTLLIDRQGRMAKAYVGAVNEQTLRGDIEQLLRAGKS
jgi:cytochrome c biogenesis protein CcmG/thiol:disulfide interchange protein DsbE